MDTLPCVPNEINPANWQYSSGFRNRETSLMHNSCEIAGDWPRRFNSRGQKEKKKKKERLFTDGIEEWTLASPIDQKGGGLSPNKNLYSAMDTLPCVPNEINPGTGRIPPDFGIGKRL
ncbi:hypothetical protein CEXT_276601 [Caerostris extrusa]|uniref:Uncharacterized protein n=1 Tax=Caerostris extrusa TaxID=172846 RepID=A0AAV4XF55_CAEEX|nr:hypothetical protein CEXT_276601 [Caerostris extrusa]